MEEINEYTTAETPKRPDFLSVICILSLIWEGLVLLLCIAALCLSGFIFNALRNFMDTDRYEQLSEMQRQGIDQLMSLGQGMFTAVIGLCVLFTAISIFGVAKMWKLKKAGFYIYTVINGIMVILNLVQLNIFMAVIGIGFIAMYGANLKHMKN